MYVLCSAAFRTLVDVRGGVEGPRRHLLHNTALLEREKSVFCLFFFLVSFSMDGGLEGLWGMVCKRKGFTASGWERVGRAVSRRVLLVLGNLKGFLMALFSRDSRGHARPSRTLYRRGFDGT